MRIAMAISITFWFGIAMLASGCGALSLPSPAQEGTIMLAADAKGMKAFGDTLNGLVTNGKASPDQDTAHWIARKAEMDNETKRAQVPGFWQKLIGK